MKKSRFIKTLLFSLTAVLLFAFALQREAKLWTFRPLEGVFNPAPEPVLSFENYRTGQYQTQQEAYLKEHFGFREPLIRFYNQFLYDFFRKTYSGDVVFGKDHWFYFKQHVNEYYGTEMYRWFDTPEEAVEGYEREVRLMWKVRAILKEYDIDFLMFMAPDKGYLYPEHLPDRKFDTTSVNAREYYAAKFDEIGFPYIEMTQWFLDLKEADTLPYSLFSQSGAHWGFSSVLAADSVFRLMEQLKGVQLPKMQIGPLHESSEKTIHGDHDLMHTANLIGVPHEYDRLYDAEVTVVADSTSFRPSVLFVGNSFLWRMHYYIPFDDMFSHSEYWFYNSTVYFGKGYSQAGKVSDLDLLSKLLESDYVVWFTDGNQMYKMSYGFAEAALVNLCYDEPTLDMRRKQLMDSLNVSYTRANELIMNDPERYLPELAGDSIPTVRNPRIPEALAIKQIKNDPDWMLAMRFVSIQRQMPLNDVLKVEANNIINHWPLMRDTAEKITREAYVESLVNDMMDEMRSKPELLEMIKEKSDKNGRSVEEQLEADARWVINDKIQRGEIDLNGFE